MLTFLPKRVLCLFIFGAFVALRGSAQTNVLTESDNPALMMETYLRAQSELVRCVKVSTGNVIVQQGLRPERR